MWKTVSLAAVISTLLLLCGFGYAVKDMLLPKGEAYSDASAPAEPPPAAPTLGAAKEIRITAVGDSLTKGTGDATGDGYVKQVVAMLKKKFPVPVTLNNNLAVNGMRADQMLERLKADRGYRLSLSQANLILFTIGGNDLFQSGTGESASEATGEFDMNKLKAELPATINRLKLVVEQLNDINPNAQIVYVGLYNPFFDLKELRDGSLEEIGRASCRERVL